MDRIVIINLGAYGHMNPTLAMTAELVRRGNKVSYFTTAEFTNRLSLLGAECIPYDSFFCSNVPNIQEIPRQLSLFPLRLMKEAAHVMPQIFAAVKELRPDLILYDQMCITGRFVAASLRVPAVTLHPTYVTPAGKGRFGFSLDLVPMDIRNEFDAKAADLARRYGIEQVAMMDLFGHAQSLNLIFMPRAFHPAGDSFDARYQFVGPGFVRQPREREWTPSSVPKEQRLFISMGTVFNNWPEFFRLSLAAFGDTTWEVHMAAGSRINLADIMETQPGNFHVGRYLPQLDIFPHTAAAIYHGGMGTTMEALIHGVPLLAIPQMPEQQATANRIAELGLGTWLPREAVSVATLTAALEEVAADRGMKERAQTMQRQILQTGGYMQAVALIETFLQNGEAKEVDPKLAGHAMAEAGFTRRS